jgi:F-type H+-transporting ATPase subunit delta
MKAEQYAQALFEAISEVRSEDQDKVLDNFVRVLASNGELNLFDQIEKEYQKLQLAAEGIKQVQVTTARADVDEKALIQELNRIVGQKVDVQHKVNENLIGGVVVKVDDTLIDASIRSNLESLKKDLKHK